MNIKNSITLIGRLTNDIEMRYTQSGTAYSHFSVAVDRPYRKDKDGKEVKECDFINCTAWGKTAEFISKYFKKGEPIMIQGELRNQNYTNKDGVKVFTYVVNVGNVDFALTAKSKTDGQNVETAPEAPSDGFNLEEFEELYDGADAPF